MVDYYTAHIAYGSGNDDDEADAKNDQQAIENNTEYIFSGPKLGSWFDPSEADHDPKAKDYSIDWERNAELMGWDKVPPDGNPDNGEDSSIAARAVEEREATAGWEFVDDSGLDKEEVSGELRWGIHGGTSKWKALANMDARPQTNESATDESGFKYRQEPYEKTRERRQNLQQLIQIHGDRLDVPEHVQRIAWKKLDALDDLRMGGGIDVVAQSLGALVFAAHIENRPIRSEEGFDEFLKDADVERSEIRTVKKYLQGNEWP